MRLVLLGIMFALATGCSTTNVTAQGEFFTLSERHVITRDLTRPVGVDNEPQAYKFHAFPQTINYQ